MAEGVTYKEFDIGVHDRVPDGSWEIVDVQFPALAHADYQIPHNLDAPNPDAIEYTVLRQSTDGHVYEDRSPTRTAWQKGYIVLRSNKSGWTGRLLLRVLKRPVPYVVTNTNSGANVFLTPLYVLPLDGSAANSFSIANEMTTSNIWKFVARAGGSYTTSIIAFNTAEGGNAADRLYIWGSGVLVAANASFYIGNLYYGTEQTVSLPSGTGEWVKMFDLSRRGFCRVLVMLSSSGSEESATLEFHNTYYVGYTQISVERQSYGPRILEVRVTGSDGYWPTVWMRVNNTGTALTLKYRVLELRDWSGDPYPPGYHNTYGTTPPSGAARVFFSENQVHVKGTNSQTFFIGKGYASSMQNNWGLAITNEAMNENRGIEFFCADGTYNPRAVIRHYTVTDGSQYLVFSSTFSAGMYAKFIFENAGMTIGAGYPCSAYERLYIYGTHGTTAIHLFAENGSNPDAHCFIWASEPTQTWVGCGISNNWYWNGSAWARADTGFGGSGIWLNDNYINFFRVTGSGTKTEVGGINGSDQLWGLYLYAIYDCSALTFTDRTPYFEGDALAAVRGIRGKQGEIDHDSLPEFARKTFKRPATAEDRAKGILADTVEEPGRNIGAMLSILTVAVQQLDAKLSQHLGE